MYKSLIICDLGKTFDDKDRYVVHFTEHVSRAAAQKERVGTGLGTVEEFILLDTKDPTIQILCALADLWIQMDDTGDNRDFMMLFAEVYRAGRKSMARKGGRSKP